MNVTWFASAYDADDVPHRLLTIAERYGLFTLIVLGDIATLVVGGVLTVFALWWLHFSQNAPQRLTGLKAALLWGYGHYLVFAAAAAVGARLAVNVAHATGHGHLSDRAAAATFTIPVAVFITLVWLLHHRADELRSRNDLIHPVAVLVVLGMTFVPIPVLATGILAAALVAATLVVAARARGGADATKSAT